MGRTVTVSYEGKPCYHIELQEDFSKLPQFLQELGYGANRACIITESNVAPLYLGEIEKLLAPVFST